MATPFASALASLFLSSIAGSTQAAFFDGFDGEGLDAWRCFAGDGQAIISLEPNAGFATVRVDATADGRNVWWAVINRTISAQVEMDRLAQAGWELRMEARIRTSHAPRRVNLSFNTNRTTNFHENLMEYDLPEAGKWKTISLTTRGFDARPDDTLNCQMALMDWGHEIYTVDVDYLRVDVVKALETGPDLGEPVPYHPSPPPLEAFTHVREANQAVSVDARFPDRNFGAWQADATTPPSPVIAVGSTKMALLGWDFRDLEDLEVAGPALLELTTVSLQNSATPEKDFGLLRICEIIGGDPTWEAAAVTWASFHQNQPSHAVVNPQMIIDLEIAAHAGSRNFYVLSVPALRRLLNGETSGLALTALGAVEASFAAADDPRPEWRPRLHLQLRERKQLNP